MTVAAIGLLAAGCATVTRGTTNNVTFNSEPTGAEVKTSLGHTCTTPCTVEVSRKSEFVAVFTKPGYKDAQAPVATRVAGAGAAGFAGNVLVGGIVGMGVDAATGATYEHFPNPVFVTLEAAKTAGPPKRAPRPKPVPTT